MQGIYMTAQGVETQTALESTETISYHLRTASKPISTFSSKNRTKRTKCTGYKTTPTT